MAVPDRLEELKEKAVVTGIDFIYIYPSQKKLDVYFYAFNEHPPAPLPPSIKTLLTDLVPADIHIYNEAGAVPDIAVTALNWTGDEVLELTVAQKADFTLYKLLINDRKDPSVDPFRIDPYYNDVLFSFKANCPSDLDCKPPAHECPPEEAVDFPVDYTARDFWSFRNALLEFASLRYPQWPDRLEADAGVMLAEVMSAVGDEMAYYQDKVGREAYLETGTQRRSLRRHARLVDYHIGDGLGSFVWIDVKVAPGGSGNLLAGTSLFANSDSGEVIDFEVGHNLQEGLDKIPYFVDVNRNEFTIYRWDEDQQCLPVNTTELFIDGDHEADLLTFDGLAPSADHGKWVLLQTMPLNPAQPARAHMVRLISVKKTVDPLFNLPITHLIWDERQALPFEMDMTILVVHGNMVPATAGKTYAQYFLTGAGLNELPAAAGTALKVMAFAENRPVLRSIERTGANDSIAYYCTLIGSEISNLVWLDAGAAQARPEIVLEILEYQSPVWLQENWEWKRTMVGVNSSGPMDPHFTLEDGSWGRVVGYWRQGQEIIHEDYASGNGMSVRFGDGEFGLVPPEKSVFRAYYRLGGGRISNVAPGVIKIDKTNPALNFIESVTNPLSARNGTDKETFTSIRQSAPEEFRTIAYRAVRTEDYAEAAERLDWVYKAGASFRWTGSWLTAFVTPDPKNAVMMTDEWRGELLDQLNRFRQAGREAYTMDPMYADLDLDIDICVSTDAYPGEVKERVLIKLFGKKGINPVKGFFDADRFSFGNYLERSVLEAAIQSVPGVKAVEGIMFRRRGVFDWKKFTEYYYDPGKNSIIRIENDLLHPERGICKIHIHGGA